MSFPPPKGLYSNEGRSNIGGGETRIRYNRDNNRKDRRFEPYRRPGNQRYNNNNRDYQQRGNRNQQYGRRDSGGGRYGGDRRNRNQNKFEDPEVRAKRMEKEREESQKRRDLFKASSRWHLDDSQYSHVVPPFPTFIPSGLPPKAIEAFLVRARLDEIEKRIQIGLMVNRAEMREPSPSPVFDQTGRRTNTRIQRLKDRLNEERSRLVEKAFKIRPTFQLPVGFKFEPRKFQKKLVVPVDKYPDYNFIGLIIGPRGSTQKRLEAETGAKIAIRGRGSVKGIKALMNPAMDEPLHVLITAEDEKTLHKAVDVIEKLLVPVDEGQNEFKRRQLRELAKIHGTLRDDPDGVGTDTAPKDTSIVSQLQNYGHKRENEMRDEDEEDDEDEDDRRRKNRDQYFAGRKRTQLGEDEKDEIFERFVLELEGKAQSLPFYKFYQRKKVKKRSIVAPGVRRYKKSHYLFCEQSRKEGMKNKGSEFDDENNRRIAEHFGFDNSAVLEFNENDPDYECLFMDNPVAPPGTLEEEVLEKVLNEKRSQEQKQQFFKKVKETIRKSSGLRKEEEEKGRVVTKEKTLQEVLKKKKEMEKRKMKKERKKQALQSRSDIPPWELEDSDSDDEGFDDDDEDNLFK